MVGKRWGKERKGKENIFRKLSFPSVKSCKYAKLEQFCISHQWARRGLLKNCCVPSTVLDVCQVLNGVLYHMIMTGDRYGCHPSFHRDPQKKEVPWEWGKGLLETGWGGFFSPWNLVITNTIFPIIFEEICGTFKAMLKRYKDQLLTRVMAVWPTNTCVPKILMKPLDYLSYVLNLFLLPIIKLPQSKRNAP